MKKSYWQYLSFYSGEKYSLAKIDLSTSILPGWSLLQHERFSKPLILSVISLNSCILNMTRTVYSIPGRYHYCLVKYIKTLPSLLQTPFLIVVLILGGDKTSDVE